jgi:hypothetical protein
MRLPQRDVIATALVAVAAALYALWALDAAPAGFAGARVTGIVVLALGFAASASAVVPGFEQLIHGNKAYLAVTSLVGLVAFGAGIAMLVSGDGVMLTVVMIAMAVLWLVSTVHHALLATRAGTVAPVVPFVVEEHRRAA